MSHDATNWAIKQRGLKPAVKIVLWHLCDRYHPDHGCFPSQETLANDCEMSRASINRHLDELEQMGLIARERQVDAETKKHRPTLYRLAFEKGFKPQDVVARVSDCDTESRVSKEAEPVSHSYETLTSNRTSKTPLTPRSMSGGGTGGEGKRVNRYQEADLWEACVEVWGHSPPTDGSDWWFPQNIIEQAKARLSA